MQNPPPTQQGYGYGQPYGTPPNAPLQPTPGGGPNDKTAIGLDAKIASALGYPIGLLLHVAWVVIFILLGIVGGVLTAIVNQFAILLALFYPLLMLVYLGSLLFCAYKAYQGETFKLPVVGDMAANFANK
jgi:uncharacterized membrane protein